MAEAAGTDYRHSHFEFPILSKIIGEPDYEQLLCIFKELKANAQSVHCTLGGGAHGYLGILVSPVQYALVSPTPFLIPAYPQPLVIPVAATQHMTITLQQLHRDSVRIFREYQAVSKALKQQIVQAIPKVYLQSLRDSITNTINQPIRGIISHLFGTYGRVTAQKIAAETEKVTSYTFDPVMPVDCVFTLVEDLAVLADAGKAPFSPEQIINFAYNVINKTRKFGNDVKLWNRFAAPNKTWISFKIHFRQAQEELRETGDLRLDEHFHHANLVQDIVSGLSNVLRSPGLDDSSISESIVDSIHPHQPPSPLYDHYGTPTTTPTASTITPSTQANAVTSSELTGLMAQIAQMQATINALVTNTSTTQQYAGYQGRGGQSGGGGRSGKGGRGPSRRDHYCYTHGACAHKSNQCRTKSDGHQDNATFEKKQGGSTKNCPT